MKRKRVRAVKSKVGIVKHKLDISILSISVFAVSIMCILWMLAMAFSEPLK